MFRKKIVIIKGYIISLFSGYITLVSQLTPSLCQNIK